MAPEPPHNAGYLLAAYIVAPVILVGYVGVLWRRLRRTVGRSDGQTVGRSEGRRVEGS
jgi:hypothetical protein